MKAQAPGKVKKEIPMAHGFRKFFNTALMNSDVHPSFKKLLMGHSVQLDEVYYDKNSEKSQAKLLEEYTKAHPGVSDSAMIAELGSRVYFRLSSSGRIFLSCLSFTMP